MSPGGFRCTLARGVRMQESHIGLIWPVATNAARGPDLLASRLRLVHTKTKEAGTRRRNSSSPEGASRIAASFGDQHTYRQIPIPPNMVKQSYPVLANASMRLFGKGPGYATSPIDVNLRDSLHQISLIGLSALRQQPSHRGTLPNNFSTALR